MKTFRIQIRAYGYYADFKLASEDSSEAFNNSLVDRLGKNDIVWDKDGFTSKYVIACCNGNRKYGKYKKYIWQFVEK